MRNCAFYNTCARTVKKIKFSAMVPFFAMRAILQPAVPAAFLPACTFVQRGSKNCFVVVVLLLGATLVRILHYCPISPCFQHIAPLHAVWPGHLARQPCPAALPGRLARWPCPVAWPGSLAHQPCRKVFKLFYGRRPACMQYCILLLGRQFSSRFPRN
jgi:hypothetical protein